MILDFILAPANEADLTMGLLFGLRERLVVGDKGYISTALAAELAGQGVRVVTLPQRNQAAQVAPAGRRLINGVRQIVETVNGQLAEQFHIETNHAYSLDGLCARLYTKLTAHTLCIKINRLPGKAEFLQIKALAWPNQHIALLTNCYQCWSSLRRRCRLCAAC